MNPLDPGYYGSDELRSFGFKSVGENVRIARNCVVISPENIEIGNNVRVDAFTSIIATGPLKIGSYIHIGGHCHLVSRGGLTMHDFSGLSQRVCIYTVSDDYSGRFMTNPTVPPEHTGPHEAPVTIGKHAIIGAGAVILPGCDIGEGSALGALSLACRPVPAWSIYAGSPATMRGERSRRLLVAAGRMRRQLVAA